NSTCDDAPCTYTWVDDGFDGSGGAQCPLGNGRTLSFTFRGASVKNVRLTVADADGDSDTTMKPITVTAASVPPPPGAASPETTPTLADGGHSVAVRSTDVAGNTDPSPATRSFTVATGPPSGTLLLGSATVQPIPDSIDAGSAEAFEATASRSGAAVTLSVYVGSGNTATAVGA